MAISDKTRKVLWARSGNRCAICKVELFQETKESNQLNIGEECHINSEKEKGPRYKSGVENYDSYENLILLCRNDHKTIDELVETYNEEILIYIKKNHENWVQKTLNKAASQKIENPQFLTRITTGKELLSIISDCLANRIDYGEIKDEKEAEYVGGVLQEIFNIGEISNDAEIYMKVKLSVSLDKMIKDLELKGYMLFGERSLRKIRFQDGGTDNWMIYTLLVRTKESQDVIKVPLEK